VKIDEEFIKKVKEITKDNLKVKSLREYFQGIQGNFIFLFEQVLKEIE